MWIVGKDNGNTWIFKGVYCSEVKAALRTEDICYHKEIIFTK